MAMLFNYNAIISTKASLKEGFGHLSRSLTLYEILSHLGKKTLLLLESTNPNALKIVKDKKIDFKIISSPKNEEKTLEKYAKPKTLLFIDKGNTCNNYHTFLSCFTVGIDNLGGDHPYFDLLYNPLPHFEHHEINIKGSEFLFFPLSLFDYIKNPLQKDQASSKGLLSFGGSDPYDLSYKAFRILKEINFPLQFTFILGPLYQGNLKKMTEELPKNIKLVGPLKPLEIYKTMQSHDFLITAFGITAFEALTLNLPVLLFNHTPYHQRLAQTVSFPMLPFSAQEIETNPLLLKENILPLLTFLKNPRAEISAIPVPHSRNQEFTALINDLFTLIKFTCPFCGKINHPIIERTPFYNTYYCTLSHKNEKDYFIWKKVLDFL
jgi:spore coat polysaccharide biosynthesis predicted glycosyltransferase SpsG